LTSPCEPERDPNFQKTTGRSKEIDLAYGNAFAFAGARCDRIVAGVMAKLEKGGVPVVK